MKHHDAIKAKEQKIDITKLKPSELLTVALADLVAIENTPGYIIDMWHWHYPSSIDNACHTCMAGAVMARRLGCEPDRYFDHEGFDRDIEKCLVALDEFRLGYAGDALHSLGFKTAAVENRDTTEYEDDREKFFTDMRQIVSELEAVGL